jgi:ribonuclease P protein subunit RPR2
MKSNRDKSFNQQKIAYDRIEKLFEQAELAFKEYPHLSKRYVALARKLSMRYKVKFTSDQKKNSCKKCDSYLKNGINCRTRLVKGKVVRTCLVCQNVRRIIYKK